MKIIAGVDIGNSTTEVCLAVCKDGGLRFLSSSLTATTGIKGSLANVHGAKAALGIACQRAGMEIGHIHLILLNQAAPVLSGSAMETITETVVTSSSMIGHNPHTPGGQGTALGELINIGSLHNGRRGVKYIVFCHSPGYEEIAETLNRYGDLDIRGLMLASDEGVLVYNRLNRKVPVLDEVKGLRRLEEGKFCAVEVAPPGESVGMLSNPYGIASLLELTPEETRRVVPIAKSLIGSRSGAVIRTAFYDMGASVIPAGEIWMENSQGEVRSVPVDRGGGAIMEVFDGAGEIRDICGSQGSSVGDMLDRIKKEALVLGESPKITGILAVDTIAPVQVHGGLGGETAPERAVGLAAMIQTRRLPMERLAEKLKEELGIYAKVAGVEAVMAALGGITTPGAGLPLCVLDLGGGSTDVALLDETGQVGSVHLAGAGEFVTLLIQTELGLTSRETAEDIKKYPLCKVESLFHIRMETGEVRFFQEALKPRLYGRVALMTSSGLMPLMEDLPMERIARVRREAKIKVFGENALRGLKAVAPGGNIRQVPHVILLGGSAEDFEIPGILTEKLWQYGITCGRGNIRGGEGSRNAVATGLCLHDI